MQVLNKLTFLVLLSALFFSCNFDREGDESEIDEDLFSGAEYDNGVDVKDGVLDGDDVNEVDDDRTSADPLMSEYGSEQDGDVDGDGTVEWTEQSARSAITANSADYDSSGIKRYEPEAFEDGKIKYLRTPESFSTSKNIVNMTGIESRDRYVKPNPLGRDKQYDGTYQDADVKEPREVEDKD